jgi:hypothetical protein
LCSAARTGSRSAFLPDGAFSQVMRDPSGSQPASGPSWKGREIPAFTRAMTCPPACRIARIRSWPGKVAVEADDAPGEQLRPAVHEPPQQGLLPGLRLAEDRAEYNRRRLGVGGQRTSASSPASLRSASQYEASGITRTWSRRPSPCPHGTCKYFRLARELYSKYADSDPFDL